MTTVLSWLAARLPLVRKKPAMSALFELQCYMVGMALPFVFTYYVVWPIVSFFVIQNIMPIWSMLIPGICVAAASVWYFFAYYCPGVAYLSGTTPLRFSIAYIVSTFLVGFIVGFVFGFVQGFLSAMH